MDFLLLLSGCVPVYNAIVSEKFKTFFRHAGIEEDMPGRYFIVASGDTRAATPLRVIDLPDGFEKKEEFDAVVYRADNYRKIKYTQNVTFKRIKENIYSSFSTDTKAGEDTKDRYYWFFNLIILENKIFLSAHYSKPDNHAYLYSTLVLGNSRFERPHAYWSLNVNESFWNPRFIPENHNKVGIYVPSRDLARKMNIKTSLNEADAIYYEMNQKFSKELDVYAKNLKKSIGQSLEEAVIKLKSKRNDPALEKKIMLAFDAVFAAQGVRAFKVKFLYPQFTIKKDPYGVPKFRYTNCLIFYKNLKGECCYSIRNCIFNYSGGGTYNDTPTMDADNYRSSFVERVFIRKNQKMEKVYLSAEGNGVTTGGIISVDCSKVK